VTRSPFTSTRIVLLLALAVLGVAAALLLVQAASTGAATGGRLRDAAFALSFVAAAIALAGAWLGSRELQRRRLVGEALRASNAKFEGILAIAVDAIITVDERQHILHFNHGAEVLFGFRESEMIGTSLGRLLPGRFREAHQHHVEAFGQASEVARRMGERRAIYGLRRDGTEFPAEASISRLDSPGGRLYTVVLRDISDRRRTEEQQRFLARAGAALSTSLDYESTLRSVVHLAIPYLADCCVLDVEDGGSHWRRLVSVHEDPDCTRRLRVLEQRYVEATDWPFGSASALATGRTLVRHDLAVGWKGEGSEEPATASVLASLGVQAFITLPLVVRGRTLGSMTLLATGGRRRWDEADVALAEDLGQRAGFAIENARLYLTAQQAAQARDEILGVVSHDLRNPLSAISMCARVLLDGPPAAVPDRQELVEAILESTHMMQRLIQDLLDVSTIESGHLKIRRQRAELPPIVESVLTMVAEPAREREVRLVSRIEAVLPHVDADAMRLEQVLANLVGNAVKFTERGGEVSIGARWDGSWVEVEVRDSGVGIPPEHLPHIFDRYWHAQRQSRTAGTGLGLAIARGIVEAHGGSLTVESTLGVGSTFRFTVPVRRGEQASDSSLAGSVETGRTNA